MGLRSRIAIEKKIVSMIVSDAIEQGCKVAVNNGDEDSPIFGDYADIMRETMHTDEEALIFYKEGKRVGMVFLVYGNDGFDAVCDHTDNLITNRILTRAEAYAMSECE